MLNITLSEFEQNAARYVADKRQRRPQKPLGHNPGNNSAHNYAVLYQAAGAEIAVAQYLRTTPRDVIAEPYQDEIGRADMQFNGFECDVKHGRIRGRNLAVNKQHLHRAWVYIAVEGAMPDYEIVGWAFGAMVRRYGEDYIGKNGEVFRVLWRRHLQPIEKLLELAPPVSSERFSGYR